MGSYKWGRRASGMDVYFMAFWDVEGLRLRGKIVAPGLRGRGLSLQSRLWL